MIDPLRFNKETALAYEINRPSFCNSCLSQKQTRNNPNVATKFCSECPAALGHAKDYGAFLCKGCDESIHDKVAFKGHVRQILVVGPGIRKKVVTRGDTVNYPFPLDQVKIRVKAKIYHGGKRIHREPAKNISFICGTSGKTLHVQVLGCRHLKAGDVGGTSDPFVVYNFSGKTLGSTRVRPRSLNPRWNNETFIVPMDDNLPNPRDLVMSQKDLFKLEVFDFDWFSQNEFLGHLEITKSKLMKMAVVANQQPIRLPLSTKESHGSASVKMGFNKKYFYFRVVRAENLDKQDPILLSNPYVRVFLGFDDAVMGTTSTIVGTVNPEWGNKASINNEFKVKIEHVLARERQIMTNIAINKEFGAHDGSGKYDDHAEHLNLVRFEIYNSRRFGKHTLLGKCSISCEEFRRLLPTFPTAAAYNLEKYSKFSRTSKAMSAVAESPFWSIFDCCRREKQYNPDDDNNNNLLHGDLSEVDSSGAVGSNINTSRGRNTNSALLGSSPVVHSSSPPGGQEGDVEMGGMHSGDVSGVRSQPQSRPQSAALRKSKSNRSMMNSFMGLQSNNSSYLPIIDEITWSAIYSMDVLMTSGKVANSNPNSVANGQIIVRLLPSNRGSVIVGLDEAVQQMSIGEKAHVKCRYDYAYNNFSMGSNIPPRSNVIFTVELLEINGKGRFGVVWRQFKRMFRMFRRMYQAAYNYVHNKEAVVDDSRPHSSKKMKRRRQSTIVERIGAIFSQKYGKQDDSDSESDESENNEDDNDEFGAGEDAAAGMSQRESGEEGSQREKRLRVDPRLRKHMNQSVRSGAQLIWGYTPPPPKPRKPSLKLVRQASKRSAVSAEDIVVGGDDQNQQQEGEEDFDEDEDGYDGDDLEEEEQLLLADRDNGNGDGGNDSEDEGA